jgi:hypothetical protein
VRIRETHGLSVEGIKARREYYASSGERPIWIDAAINPRRDGSLTIFYVELGAPVTLKLVSETVRPWRYEGRVRDDSSWRRAIFRYARVEGVACPEIWTWYNPTAAALEEKRSSGRALDHMTDAILMHDSQTDRFMAIDGSHRLTFLAKEPPQHDAEWPVFVYQVSPHEFMQWFGHPETEGRHPECIQAGRAARS